MGAGCWLKFYMKTFFKLKLDNFQAFFLSVHFEYFESKLSTMTMDETPQPYCSDLQSCLEVRVVGRSDLLLLRGSGQSELAPDLHRSREFSSPGAQQAKMGDLI